MNSDIERLFAWFRWARDSHLDDAEFLACYEIVYEMALKTHGAEATDD